MQTTYRDYRTHAAVNAHTGIATSLHTTSGNHPDNKTFISLREHELTFNLPTRAYGGDKAYDDTDIFERLQQEGLGIAIALRGQRTAKKDPSTQCWLDLEADAQY